jgi:hypothetical protein
MACFDISLGFSDNSSARIYTRVEPAVEGWYLEQC